MLSSAPKEFNVKAALKAAFPIMAGYVAIGLPCGLMEQQIGMSALQAFMLSFVFYSGAGQFMIPNMMLAGTPLLTIIASVSFVNSRQVLYSASLSQFCQGASKRLTFLFMGGVTDESYGVNVQNFLSGKWTVGNALLVNFFSCSSWALSNMAGVLLGNLVSIPVALGSFAMTSIFICLLCSQKLDSTTAVVIVVTMVSVLFFKLVGLSGPAILLGACMGVLAGIVKKKMGSRGPDGKEEVSA